MRARVLVSRIGVGGPDLPGAEIVGGTDALKNARQIRDAEKAEPGLAQRAVD